MSEHRCEWYFDYVTGKYRCLDDDCKKSLTYEDAERRLNATEALPAKKARTAASLIRGHTVKHDVKEYARILSGGE